MEPIVVALMLAYGGSFADNVGLRASATSGPFGASVGVAYTHYLTVTAAPEVRLGVGDSDLVFRAGYAYDRDSAGGVGFSSHNALVSIGWQAPVSDRTFVEAELTPVRYPFHATTTFDDESRDVPLDATDSEFFVPGIGLGYLPLE